MIYYAINVVLCSPAKHGDVEDRFDESFSRRICADSISANEKLDRNVNFFVCDVNDTQLELLGIVGFRNNSNVSELAIKFSSSLGFEAESATINEITTGLLRFMIHKAARKNFIEDREEIEISLGIPAENRRFGLKTQEFVADDGTDGIFEKCSSTFLCSDLRNEIERIFSRKSDRFIGHPVHYALISDDMDDSKAAINILVSALNASGRLLSRRVTIVSPTKRVGMKVSERPTLDMNEVSLMYRASSGGTVALIPEELDYESETADPNMCNVDELALEIIEHRRECLTILIFGKNNIKSLDKLKSRLGNMRIVDIMERPVNGKDIKDILKERARINNIREVDSLFALVDESGERSYYPSDIEHLFNDWLDNHLCTEFFTQYSDLTASGKQISPVIGDAFNDLQSLIGLKSAKKVVKQALDFYTFQNRYANYLGSVEKPSRHMVFTGNPGTAKTTVARLFAQIMKDNQVLPRGDLIEVGRKDLVGKYVGWTARLVEEAFNKARGSVLFIDEAYSLCDDRSGMYGDEAINTIVQMMENRRDETIVIFAGYPDKMEAFLDRNPGLRSRISFHVDFDDYDENELVQILELMADRNNVRLDFGVNSKVRSIIRQAMGRKDFGNGRFIRNLFEKARMAQASRIMAMDAKLIDKDAVCTLIADDFEIPDEIRPRYLFQPIGFVG